MRILALIILCISLHGVEVTVNQYKIIKDDRIIEGIARETRPNYYDIHIYFNGRPMGAIPNIHHSEFIKLDKTVTQTKTDKTDKKDRRTDDKKTKEVVRPNTSLPITEHPMVSELDGATIVKIERCHHTAQQIQVMLQSYFDYENKRNSDNQLLLSGLDRMMNTCMNRYETYILKWKEKYIEDISVDDVDDRIEERDIRKKTNSLFGSNKLTMKEEFINRYNSKKLEDIDFYRDVLAYTDQTWPIDYLYIMYGLRAIEDGYMLKEYTPDNRLNKDESNRLNIIISKKSHFYRKL